MKSHKESNSAPKLLLCFNFRANHPSKKSKIEANIIKKTATIQSSAIENLIDVFNTAAENIVEKINDFLVDFLG